MSWTASRVGWQTVINCSAFRLIWTFGDGLKIAALSRNIRKIALSGGVLQNATLADGLFEQLKAQGFDVLVPKTLPANDGGLSLGQAAIAAAR
ncbi:hypothetical protein [Roseibium sp.]|uniref:Kae1-like domain-containing protein n=1 Tax=Roseibium sp. TaxID=1936156 RepID=UPI003D14A774